MYVCRIEMIKITRPTYMGRLKGQGRMSEHNPAVQDNYNIHSKYIHIRREYISHVIVYFEFDLNSICLCNLV